MAQTAPAPTQVQPETDEAVFKRFAVSREARDLEILVGRYQVLAYRVALCVCNNSSIAEESVQESFMRLTRTEVNFVDRGPGSFRAWFCQLVTNVTRTGIRKESRIGMRSKKLESISEHSRVEPENAPISGEQQDAVARALSEVEEEFRIPIVLHVMEGWSQAEIGKMIGVSQSQVSRRIDEGLELLRRRLSRVGITGAAAIWPIMQSEGFMPLPPQLADKLGALTSQSATIPATIASKGVTTASKSAFTKYALAGVLLLAGVVVYSYDTSPPAQPSSSVATAPFKGPDHTFMMSWNFDEPLDNTGISVWEGKWHQIKSGGLNNTGCMEMDSQRLVLHFDKPPENALYSFTYSYSGPINNLSYQEIDTDSKKEDMEYGVVRDLRTTVTKPGQTWDDWRTSTFYFSDHSVIARDNDGLVSVHFVKRRGDTNGFELILKSQLGKFRIDQLTLKSILPSEMPDISAYRKAVELIPEPQRKDHMTVQIVNDPLRSQGRYFLQMYNE